MRAFQRYPGAPVSFQPPVLTAKALQVPCGKCIGCRLDYSRDWAIRCVHESQMHDLSSFVTLTYDPQNLPSDWSLHYRDFWLFLRRVRKRYGSGVRFFMCGEYSEDGRPHFHALLFGVWFDDRVFFKSSESGARVYRSATLERMWPLGFASVGDVTFESAGYIARYVMKTPAQRMDLDTYLDVSTGELYKRKRDFCNMSRRPGIGADWLEKFWTDVYPFGMVTIGGRQYPAPRYYDLKFQARDPVGFEKLQRRRELLASVQWEDNSPRRLRVKEQVLEAKVSQLKRSL